ncbi:MAG TPA: hypothetical protein VHB79_27470 [Polyangiaceae bacterium]|nr:hypothetical protein [Polyangiaceae bacterium]
MSSLSPSIQSVVQLFRGPLAGVRFGAIDASGLGNLAAEVEAAAAEVEAQEAKLVELRQGLAQRQESLLTLAQQALAYARIYAEGDDALTAELNQIALPRPTKPRKKDAPAKPTEREAATVVDSEASASEPAPESSEVAVVRETEAEPEEAEAAPVVTRRARGRAKTGTART